MTLATGAAVFLFIASAVLTNITFLASSGTTALSAPEAARDAAAGAPQPQAGAATTNTPTVRAPNAVGSPTSAAFGAFGSPTPPGAATVTDDAQKNRVDQASTGPSAAPAAAVAPQDAGRVASSAPQRPQLLNPWLWLVIALISAAIAFVLHRRLRASV
jgi:hypothetical protein